VPRAVGAWGMPPPAVAVGTSLLPPVVPLPGSRSQQARAVRNLEIDAFLVTFLPLEITRWQSRPLGCCSAAARGCAVAGYGTARHRVPREGGWVMLCSGHPGDVGGSLPVPPWGPCPSWGCRGSSHGAPHAVGRQGTQPTQAPQGPP